MIANQTQQEEGAYISRSVNALVEQVLETEAKEDVPSDEMLTIASQSLLIIGVISLGLYIATIFTHSLF